ncbi:MAG: T9SS type A sorting domain-containing protein [Mangrovimonas sp.]|nr:T9SS type A sorting domain-containing protein [Mangrovimonas sp.]
MKRILLITLLFIAFSVNAQFRLVRNINPGLNESIPNGFYIFNNKLYFSAIGSNLRMVYVTDGTTSGTLPIEFNSAGSGIYVQSPALSTNTTFFEYNNELYFDAKSPGNRVYIVKLLGTNTFTESPSIADVTSISNSASSRFAYPALFNDKIVYSPFIAASGAGAIEPYVIDFQTPANTGVLKNVNPIGNGESDPEEFTSLPTGILFSAYDPTNGRELWKTDGTTAGTILFNDLNSGIADSNPNQFNVLGAQLSFVATHSTFGRELFKTNGNTGNLVLVKDINTSGDGNPTNVKEINGTLYFGADNGTTGNELWKSNGTSFGTTLIKDINPSGDSFPAGFTIVGSTIYFVADDGVNGRELWKTDGTAAGTFLVKDINPSGSSNIRNLIEYNGKLYFNADNGINGEELWVSDGTSAGTLMLELNPSASAQYTSMIVFNNELFFGAVATPYVIGSGIGNELYAYKDPALSTTDFQLNENTVSLFPNPTNNYFEIQSKEMLTKVEVYSLQGQLVKSFLPQNRYDISELSNGMYFINIQANGNSISKRLIKQ